MAIEFRLAQIIRETQAKWMRNITYREISESTGIAESTIARLKSEARGIRFDVLDRLCEFFDVEPGDLIARIQESVDESESES